MFKAIIFKSIHLLGTPTSYANGNPKGILHLISCTGYKNNVVLEDFIYIHMNICRAKRLKSLHIIVYLTGKKRRTTTKITIVLNHYSF